MSHRLSLILLLAMTALSVSTAAAIGAGYLARRDGASYPAALTRAGAALAAALTVSAAVVTAADSLAR
ncbi:hypothetical protein [Streptomyces sp. NBC_01565]|uniref:hypothetical protein n=1 Tax=unclassified Streptomyces TaxID=2593676 RepID=UPI0022514709|nr:hypothetical protein [Streptomyces sp. NBC_01565]MCX4545825.1 hypothetical protein [Streptomyces sp. NBC_01565]